MLRGGVRASAGASPDSLPQRVANETPPLARQGVLVAAEGGLEPLRALGRLLLGAAGLGGLASLVSDSHHCWPPFRAASWLRPTRAQPCSYPHWEHLGGWEEQSGGAVRQPLTLHQTQGSSSVGEQKAGVIAQQVHWPCTWLIQLQSQASCMVP